MQIKNPADPSGAPEVRRPVVDQVFGDNKAPLDEVLKADYADMQQAFADLLLEAGDLPTDIKTEADNISVGKWIVKARAYTKHADEVRTQQNRPVLAVQRGINAFFGDIAAPTDQAIKAAQKRADAYVQRKAAEARAQAQREAEAARAKAEAERQKAESMKTADAAGRAEGRAEALDAAADTAEERALASTADLVRSRAEGVTASGKQAWVWEWTDKDAAYRTLGPLGNFMAEADVARAINAMVRAQKGRASLPGIKVFEKAVASFRG